MNIALMAHNNRKELMVQLCIAYCGIFARHTLCATSTTGKQISEATGLQVSTFMDYANGGCQQIGARIAYNEIDMVILLNDPQDTTLDEEIKYLGKLCDSYCVPMATNIASAEMLIQGLARGDLDWRELTMGKNNLIV